MSPFFEVVHPGGRSETIHPHHVESIRAPENKLHSPQANAVIRTASGREIAVVDDYEKLVIRWEMLMRED